MRERDESKISLFYSRGLGPSPGGIILCVWSVCRWLSEWRLVFVLFEVGATQGDGCGVWEHFHRFKEMKSLQSFLKLYGLVYETLKLLRLTGEHNMVVLIVDQCQKSPGLIPMVYQFSFLVFLKFLFRISGGLKMLRFQLRILVEDSATGAPNSITVRIEY